MADIKPAEVSAILREQLSGFRSEAELQEVGTVLQVGDGIARIYGLTGVQYGELIEFDGGMQGIALNLEEDNVGAVLLGASNNIKEGKRANDRVLLIKEFYRLRKKYMTRFIPKKIKNFIKKLI